MPMGEGVKGLGLTPTKYHLLPPSLMRKSLLQFFLFLISQRWGLDRKGRLAIESYIRGNNLALDVSSVLDGYADKITFN